MARHVLVRCAAICGAWLLACGDDSGSAGGGGGGAATQSCYSQCEAQEDVQGCMPFVDLATCKQLCDGLVSGLASGCDDEFIAYYECSANDGFKCVGSLVGQATSACDAAQDAYDACQNGPGGTQCAGANASGTCPQVACPCPSGTVMVSGFDNAGGSCACWDENTCQDLTCD